MIICNCGFSNCFSTEQLVLHRDVGPGLDQRWDSVPQHSHRFFLTFWNLENCRSRSEVLCTFKFFTANCVLDMFLSKEHRMYSQTILNIFIHTEKNHLKHFWSLELTYFNVNVSFGSYDSNFYFKLFLLKLCPCVY